MRLEHCPFCGADMAGGLSAIPECAGRMQWLTCAGCGARGPEVPRSLPYAAAVDAWNKRAPDGVIASDGSQP